LSEG